MKRKNRGGRWAATLSTLMMLIVGLAWSLAVSGGGLGFSARWGIRKQKIQTVTDTCIQINIVEQFDGLKCVDSKSYGVRLRNGETYRLNTTDIEKAGITEKELSSVAGSVVTVEYVDISVPVYPLLSLETEQETLISKDFALEEWDNIWDAAHLLLAFFGGIPILLLLCDNLPRLIRFIRKKHRLRRKKLRRQEQLARKGKANR